MSLDVRRPGQPLSERGSVGRLLCVGASGLVVRGLMEKLSEWQAGENRQLTFGLSACSDGSQLWSHPWGLVHSPFRTNPPHQPITIPLDTYTLFIFEHTHACPSAHNVLSRRCFRSMTGVWGLAVLKSPENNSRL